VESASSQLSSAGLGGQNCLVVTRSSSGLGQVDVVCNHHVQQIAAWGITFWTRVGVTQSALSFAVHRAAKENCWLGRGEGARQGGQKPRSRRRLWTGTSPTSEPCGTETFGNHHVSAACFKLHFLTIF